MSWVANCPCPGSGCLWLTVSAADTMVLAEPPEPCGSPECMVMADPPVDFMVKADPPVDMGFETMV